MSNKHLARLSLILLYVVALCIPPYVFFHNRGGTAVIDGLDSQATLQVIFPLLGLYAFTFVTFQILVATNLRWLMRLWPQIIHFHRFQGGFALLFACLHPLFILIGFGLSTYIDYGFVPSSQKWWLIPGYAALVILLCTVITATLAWYGRNLPWWRKLHKLNYLVFALVWTHSWFIGTDTQFGLLRIIWIVYLVVVSVSILGKYRTQIIYGTVGRH